jgi:hypothetical protein
MLGQAPAAVYPDSAPASQQYYEAPPGGYPEAKLTQMATAPCLPAAAPDGAAAYATASPIGYPASSHQATRQGMTKGSFVAPACGSNAQGSPMQHQQGCMAPMPAGPTLGAATVAAASVAALQVPCPIHGARCTCTGRADSEPVARACTAQCALLLQLTHLKHAAWHTAAAATPVPCMQGHAPLHPMIALLQLPPPWPPCPCALQPRW